MKLYEYKAKEIFLSYGIPVPKGRLATSPESTEEIAKKLGTVVLKAQVLAGGRGKAGGVVIAQPDDAKNPAQRILGMKIKGEDVKKLLIEEYKKPEKEMYLGITIDRRVRRPVIIVSSEGGIDIEETAKKFPEKILRMHINPLTGIHDYQARRLAYYIDKKNSTLIIDIIKKLYKIFTDYDCTLAEINPLAQSEKGIFALDAKIVIDDNALFRQQIERSQSCAPSFPEGIEAEEPDELSAIAKKSGMSYVGLDGDIGCIVNGAGLAMATLDMIAQYGRKPANFMDIRAGAGAEQIKTALKLVSSNRNVKVILINIFGGITKCDEIAKGIIDVEIKIPVVIRLTGTNEEEGRSMLERHGITWASTTEEAAKAVVEIGHSHK